MMPILAVFSVWFHKTVIIMVVMFDIPVEFHVLMPMLVVNYLKLFIENRYLLVGDLYNFKCILLVVIGIETFYDKGVKG